MDEGISQVSMSKLSTADALRLRGLHLLARIALRVRPPLGAKALVDQIGAKLPSLRGLHDARAGVQELFPAGSCLSRALTIAALLPGAEVVIGVDSRCAGRLTAHAWLEIDSVRVDTDPVRRGHFPDELARLPPGQARADNRLRISLSATAEQSSRKRSFLGEVHEAH